MFQFFKSIKNGFLKLKKSMTIQSKVNLKFLQVLYAFILSVRCLILLHVKASPQVLVLYHSSFINGFLLNDHFIGIGKGCVQHRCSISNEASMIGNNVFYREKIRLESLLLVCLYCFNTPDSFFHVKIVSVLAWELRMENDI